MSPSTSTPVRPNHSRRLDLTRPLAPLPPAPRRATEQAPPPVQQPRALLLENVHEQAVHDLRDAGFDVAHHEGALSEDELIAALPGVQVLGVRSATRITRRVLEAAPDLRAIGAFCIGTDQTDLAAATEQGVAVFNAPYANSRSVVELAVAQIIALNRGLYDKDRDLQTGRWNKTAVGSREVRGQRLGIVGYGSIGSQLSVVAEALGMQVLFYDVADTLALGNARRCATLEELLGNSDVVSLHVDGRPQNTHLIGAAELDRMLPGSVLLNLCRGNVVDTGALAAALRSGHLAGAALDVHPDEPTGDQVFRSPLQGLRNVALTPHIGGSTAEAQLEIGSYVANKLRQHHEHGTTAGSKNLP